MERDSILFYRSFYEAIRGLQKDIQLEIYTAIMEYGLNGNLTENLKPVARGMFALIKPVIDNNNVRFENGKKGAEHGRRGGRPRKNTLPPPETEAYALSFREETDLMKADIDWSASIRDDYGLSATAYATKLRQFLKLCEESRGGRPHTSIQDAKRHFRYWLDKTGKNKEPAQPVHPQQTPAPDDDLAGFGGVDYDETPNP